MDEVHMDENGAAPQNEEEAIAVLQRIVGSPENRESEHVCGDELAWSALRVLGWGRLADALEDAAHRWWYS